MVSMTLDARYRQCLVGKTSLNNNVVEILELKKTTLEILNQTEV